MEHLDDAAVAKLADYVAKGGVLQAAVRMNVRGDVVIYTSSSEKDETFGTSDVGEALLGAAPKGGKLTLPAYGVAVIRVK